MAGSQKASLEDCAIEFDYVVVPVIQTEDELVHTAENGYVCGDPECLCATIGYGEVA